MTDQTLTTNEQEVYNFIISEEEEAGWGPTLSEICKATGKDKSSVKGILGSLAAKNAVESYKEVGFPTVFCSLK